MSRKNRQQVPFCLLVIGNTVGLFDLRSWFIKFSAGRCSVFQICVFCAVWMTLALLLPFCVQLDTGNLFAGGRLHFNPRPMCIWSGLCAWFYALNRPAPGHRATRVFYAGAADGHAAVGDVFLVSVLTKAQPGRVNQRFCRHSGDIAPGRLQLAALAGRALGSAAAPGDQRVWCASLPRQQSEQCTSCFPQLSDDHACMPGFDVLGGARNEPSGCFISARRSSLFNPWLITSVCAGVQACGCQSGHQWPNTPAPDLGR